MAFTAQAGKACSHTPEREGNDRRDLHMLDDFEPITSQEQFDQAIKARIERAQAKAVERFADYDDLKAKAERLDDLERTSKADIDAANERIRELEDAAAKRDEADAVREARDRVSRETGVPASLLQGETEEDMAASAKALNDFALSKAPGYPLDKGGAAKADPAQTRRSIEEIRNPAQRVMARAANISLYQ